MGGSAVVLVVATGCLHGGSCWLHPRSLMEVAAAANLHGSLGAAARSGGWWQLLGGCMLVGGERWEERAPKKEKKKMSESVYRNI